MLLLDFSLVPIELTYAAYYRQLETVDIGDINYYLFHGNIVFRVGAVDFGMPSNTVPVVDFAAVMLSVAAEIWQGRRAEFEYTEGEGTIFFVPSKRGAVEISCDFHKERSTVDVLLFCREVKVFADRVFAVLQRDFPPILNNPEFIEWFEPRRRDLAGKMR
jgi:hypothetical protein